MKLYDTQGLAGCVVRYNSRFNGRLVAIYNAEQASLGKEGWATVCENHNTICIHKTLAIAKNQIAYPPGWCEKCNTGIYRKPSEGLRNTAPTP